MAFITLEPGGERPPTPTEAGYVRDSLELCKRGVFATAALWVGSTVLEAGQLGVESDTGRSKIGNGTDTWEDLPYADAAVEFPVTKWPATFSVISANGTTMVAGTRYALNTTSGALTITLPLAPAVGTCIELFDAQGTWFTYNGTLARNGELIEGVASNRTLNNTARLLLEYVGGAKGWRVIDSSYVHPIPLVASFF
jgi:hypothetical protein